MVSGKVLTTLAAVVFVLVNFATVLAAESIVSIRPGNDRIAFYDSPGGKVIARPKSSVVLRQSVASKAGGYLRLIGFGRTVWIKEKTVRLSDLPGIDPGMRNSRTQNVATSGIDWID